MPAAEGDSPSTFELGGHQYPGGWLVAPLAVSSWGSFTVLLGFLVLCFVLTSRRDGGSTSSLTGAPVLGDSFGSWWSRGAAYMRWSTDGVAMLKEGYRSSPDALYRVPTFQPFYTLPPKYLDSLNDVSRTELDPTHAIVWYFLGKYTGVDFHLFGRPLWASVRKLTASLPPFIPTLHQLSMRLSNAWFPATDDWTVITPWPQVLRLVTATNARLFAGEKFCDDAVWLEATEQYVQNIAVGSALLKLVPDLLKPACALVLPQLYRIRRARKLVIDAVVSEVELRQQTTSENRADRDRPESDMLKMVEQVPPASENSPEQTATRVLALCLAGTHGPSNHVMNVMLDLAARWDEYADELREELDAVLAEEGGVLTSAGLDKLHKLDSFMKESARLEPGSALSFLRKVLEPVQLSTGETLPSSVMISVPAVAGALSEAFYGSDAGEFDGWRFYRRRRELEDADSESQSTSQDYLWTSPSSGYLNFGYGRYACPGRFYASAQTKLIVVSILQRYDLRLLSGETRPQSLAFGDANVPDPKAKLLCRRRLA